MEELYSLLIPLHKGRLIVPRSCVAEVVRYAGVADGGDPGEWFRGQFEWNGQSIPIVSFEALCGLPSAEAGGRTRVAVFHGLTGVLPAGYFGILTEGFPQLVRVNREVMQLSEQQAWPEDGPVICQIRMINEYPLVPDLERIEGLIQSAMASDQAPA